MTQTSATTSGDALGAEAFEAQAKRHELFAIALFRLFKLANLHSLSNQAVARGLETTTHTMHEVFAREQGDLALLFAQDNIFVQGTPLKASRASYESLRELGALLDSIQVNQLIIRRGVTGQELHGMLVHYLSARSTPTPQKPTFDRQLSASIRLQRIDLSLLFNTQQDAVAPATHVSRLMATAITLLRRCLERYAQGDGSLVSLIKRLAQDLTITADTHPDLLIRALHERPSRHEHAHIAVQSACLSALMARALTRDASVILDIVHATLLMPLAHTRLEAHARHEDPFGADELATQLSERDLDHLPASAALVMVTQEGFHERALRRALLANEAHALLRQARCGLPHQGQLSPHIESALIATTTAFQRALAIEEITPPQTSSPDQALATLIKTHQSPAERLMLKLLCATLGLYPRGTLVALSSGAHALVCANHARPDLYARPLIYLVTPTSRFVNLAHLTAEAVALGHITRSITERPTSLADAQRALFAGQLVIPHEHTTAQTHATQHTATHLDFNPESEPHDVQANTAVFSHRDRLDAIASSIDANPSLDDFSPDPNFFSRSEHD